MVADTVSELKPRGIMELFDQAVRLYRNNFFKFVGIIAVAQVPLQIVQLLISVLFFQGAINDPSSRGNYLNLQSFGTIVSSLILAVLTLIFVSGLATAALTQAITDSYLGEEVSIGGAYRKIKGVWGSLLAALFWIALLSIPALIWTLVPCIGWLTGFGILFFLGVVVAPIVAPIIVIERRNSGSAIRRAWELARRRFWWLTGFFLLLMLFNFLVVQGPVQIVTMAIQSSILQGLSSANLASLTTLQAVSTSVMTLILSLLYYPLASTCATLAYFDLRVRQEGFDLALMANQGGEAPVSALELASQAPAIPPGPLITWPELGNFALVSFITAGIYIVIAGFFMALTMIIMGGVGV